MQFNRQSRTQIFHIISMKNEMNVTERSMLSLLRKMNFIDASGVPTELYKDFRNPSKSKNTMGKAIEIAFAPLYQRNEYIHKAKREDLRSTIASVTGNDHDSKAVESTIGTFEALKTFAAFDFKNLDHEESDEPGQNQKKPEPPAAPIAPVAETLSPQHQNLGLSLGLGYTINLILPETTDIEVFNSIFKSLNENLLRRS